MAYKPLQRQFPLVGHCIYCGSDGGGLDGLTREHIFPKSLGGTLTLLKSSCYPCAEITRDFEHTCARKMFGKFRIIFNLPTGHKKKRPTELDLELEIDGKPETIEVPIEDYPTVPILFPVFLPPGILRGVDPTNVFGGMEVYPAMPFLPDNDARLKRIRERIGKLAQVKWSSEIHLGPFTRMLAKIAHSHAVAEFGPDSFEPFLPDIILGRSEHISHFVGCIKELRGLKLPQKFEDGTHRLLFALARAALINPEGKIISDRTFLAAAIQLFKDLETPIYAVVIGIPDAAVVRSLEETALPEAQIWSAGIAPDPRR